MTHALSDQEKIIADLVQDNIIVWDIRKGRELYKLGYYGKPLGIPKPKTFDFEAPLILDVIEAVYLVEKGIISVKKNNTLITLEELKEYGKRNYERFEEKYLVYKDLRDRGFVVTPGIKFGSDFAVYKHGPGIDHAPFIVQVKLEDDELSAAELIRAGRLATTVRKHFVIAIPDLVNKRVTYLAFEWWRA